MTGVKYHRRISFTRPIFRLSMVYYVVSTLSKQKKFHLCQIFFNNMIWNVPSICYAKGSFIWLSRDEVISKCKWKKLKSIIWKISLLKKTFYFEVVRCAVPFLRNKNKSKSHICHRSFQIALKCKYKSFTKFCARNDANKLFLGIRVTYL